MANPLLSDGRAYDSQAANPVGTEQWQRNLPTDMRWQAPTVPFNLYKWIKDTQPQNIAGELLKALGAGALAGPEMMGRAMRGEYDPDSSVDREAMADLAGVVGGSAFGGRSAPILRSLAGPMSKRAKLGDMMDAKNLLAKGVLPREVLLKKGWWQSPQGQMMSEISDNNMLLRVNESSLGKGLKTDKSYQKVNAENLRGQNLPDIIEHPEFFAHYPDMKGVKVRNDVAFGASGGWDPWNHQINLAPGWMPTNEMAKILGHEMTHATQSFNGWRNGSSPTVHLTAKYWDTAKQSGQVNDSFRQMANSRGVNLADQAELLSYAKRAAEYRDTMTQSQKKQMEVAAGQAKFPWVVKSSFLPKDPEFIQYYKYLTDFPEAGKLLSEAGELLVRKQQMELAAVKAYGNVTGEVEARAVERRLNLLPDTRRRGRPFWEDYVVRASDQTPGKILPWMGGKP